MKNETHLFIPQPCHEDWNNMTPETQGRFCASCQKTVVDFSLMTDNEVISYLSKQTGNVCGRFDTEQLQRPLIETQLQPHKNWKYWLASVSALFLLGNKSSAQTTQQSTFQQNNTEKASEDTLKYPSIKGKVLSERLLEGVVTDTTGRPLWGASVKIQDSKVGTMTDSLGRFKLHRNSLPDTFTLIIAYVGYKKEELKINKAHIQKLNIRLEEQKMNLDEVITIGYAKGAVISCVMGGITSLNKSKAPKVTFHDKAVIFIKNTLGINPFETYPNPVNKNSSFHIRIKDSGTYELQLLDNKSRPYLIQKNIAALAKEVVNINVPSNVASGIYYIRLTNTVTKKQWVDKLIVQ